MPVPAERGLLGTGFRPVSGILLSALADKPSGNGIFFGPGPLPVGNYDRLSVTDDLES
jgi:hypothetical protein